MKIKDTKLSKRTLALLAATVLLFGSGSYVGTKAALTYFSEDYTAGFELDHLQVHLIENGKDVCHDKNAMTSVHRYDNGKARDTKYRGNLLETNLGYSNPEDDASHYGKEAAYKLGTPGKVAPGFTYKEEISAKNGNNVDEYVRLTVKKYWVKDGKKDTRLSPDLIKLTYGDKDYNSSAWALNKKESTPESQTYYLRKMLPANESSGLLFDSLTIDGSITADENMTVTEKTSTEGNKKVTVYTYSYDYDDYTFYIEADVQAIQTHNVNDAITSLWGVSNVSASNGTVTVK